MRFLFMLILKRAVSAWGFSATVSMIELVWSLPGIYCEMII